MFRRAARAGAAAAIALALVQCGEQGRFGTAPTTPGAPTGPDLTAPTVTIIQPATTLFPVGVGDSVLVQFRIQDDRGVVSVDLQGVANRGSVSLGTDTAVTRFQQRTFTLAAPNRDTTLTRYLRAVPGDSTVEPVTITVTATDSTGKKGSATVTVRITSGPRLTMLKPTAGAVTSIGKSIVIEILAEDPQGVRVVGWRASGVVTAADSVVISTTGALPKTYRFTDTLTVPNGTAAGTMRLTPFGVDSLGDVSGSQPSVSVTVQSAASDATPPAVTFTVTTRVEGDDSVSVRATDASGIARLGFTVTRIGTTTRLSADSLDFSGNQTDVSRLFALKLDTITTFPLLVVIRGFAVDSVGNRGLSAKADTITVVAGRTYALPSGGAIADAIYNRNRNELYLSNVLLNRIEVFNVATNTFLAGGVPVGSRPFGLALWPRDNLGNYGDTVVVANSGGTNLSIVDVVARVERRRQRLPNYLIRKVRSIRDPNTGLLVPNIIEFDYSDRPLWVATVCRSGCAQVYAVYSTTPTPAQSQPDRGYLAWEELTAPTGAPQGHFFWEHAAASASLSSDTLEVVAIWDTAFGATGQITRTLLGAGQGQLVDFNQLVFQDTTFVRNSGDFNSALIGEGGGQVSFARALTFDARGGVSAMPPPAGCGAPFICTGERDNGISPGVFVRDFIANRSSRVRAVAMNFNGRTNLVRADSIYVFDATLRQTGILQVGGANPGMDLHPNHRFDATLRGTGGFGGTLNPNDRLLFTARPDANIEVFDTYFYGRVSLIPTRDALIGPVRVAATATGQILVGVTASGVVVVPLPNVTNIFPIQQGVGTR